MAEIAGRRRGELVRGVFEVLMDKADGLPAAQVLKAVEQTVPPSEFERETYPRNPAVRRYEKTIRFATTLYISAAGFSSQAEREARSQEKRRLKLIDLERFVELWVQHMQGLPDPDRRRLPLKPVYFLASIPE
jgi:hypothetical protein